MTMEFNIGVLQLSMEPVQETVAMAKACENAGFDAFWIAEAYPWWRKHSFEARSSTATLAIIAAKTEIIQLGWGIISPYTRPPVHVAGTGPAMQRLGGSLGDGLLTASITTPAFVRYSKKNMEEGAAKAGRDASNLILGCVIVGSIGRDSNKGKEGAREQAAMY